jgi:hypothetical protein
MPKNFLVISIIILLLITGLVGLWYFQRNNYSKEILKVEILGPEVVQAGEEIEYLVRYKNNGDVILENPELIFEYPEHSILEDNTGLRITEKVDDIYPGEEKSFRFKARLIGKENEIITANTWINYQPKNLKARYESKTSFSTQIKFVPLTFEFDLASKIEAGQKLNFSLNYFSNFNCELSDLKIKLIYPDNFLFESSIPQPIDKTEWQIPLLIQASGGRIRILGDIDGNAGDQKVFRAELGMYMDGEFVILKETAQSIQIIEPAIYISQIVNNSPNYIANPGDLLHYEIFFKNIGRKSFTKKFLLVKLDSEAFDIETLRSDRGETGPGDNSIIFDWKNIPKLSFLDAGEEGKVEFWVKVKDENFNQESINLVLRNEVLISEAEKEFEIKLNSKLDVLQKAYFQEEFFGNSGPLPPKVGESTTYTILWQVKNYSNQVSNVKVKAVLPSNVKPTGNFFPEDSKFTFDSVSKEVIWNIGNIDAYQGTGKIPLTLAFQVKLTPSTSQIGETAILVKEASVVGQDKFSQDILSSDVLEIDTSLPEDESINYEQGIISNN